MVKSHEKGVACDLVYMWGYCGPSRHVGSIIDAGLKMWTSGVTSNLVPRMS